MKVAVVGSGTMGSGLVQLFSQSIKIDSVIWNSRTNEAAQRSRALILKKRSMLVKRGKLTEAEANFFDNKIQISDDYDSVYGVDLVIEAVSEDIVLKKEIFSRVSRVVGANTILASNTSSLSITEIASVVNSPENVIGLHFFNPAPVMLLSEIVSGMLTSESTKQSAYDFAVMLGKKPIFVNEAPGFVVNRMLIPMINEGVGILAEGVAVADDIDEAMRNGANHPIGPLALADLIGNDVCLSIMEVLHAETGDPKYRAHPLLRKMVRAGLLGRKVGKGFYVYKSEV